MQQNQLKSQPETEQATEKTSGYIWGQEDILCENNWKNRLKGRKWKQILNWE
jgi:hypothetical protein